ncbi:MAG: ABC transporter substrate-binding protein, partial [Rhabdaerophilum sp.]
MTKLSGFDRRSLLKTAALGSIATIGMPAVLRAQAPAIKIGILQPVTGALAQDGEYGRLGAEIALKELNAAGGIKSMGGAKLEMVFGDARSNPEGGTQ